MVSRLFEVSLYLSLSALRPSVDIKSSLGFLTDWLVLLPFRPRDLSQHHCLSILMVSCYIGCLSFQLPFVSTGANPTQFNHDGGHRWVSNPRPPDCQSGVLPTELLAHKHTLVPFGACGWHFMAPIHLRGHDSPMAFRSVFIVFLQLLVSSSAPL